MKVINYDEALNTATINTICHKRLDLLSSDVFELISSIPASDYVELMDILNRINNQNITELQLPVCYKHGDKLLPVSSFSTAERLFIVTYAAIKNNVDLFAMGELRGLEYKTLDLYINIFRPMDVNNHIHLVSMGSADTMRYTVALKGELLC